MYILYNSALGICTPAVVRPHGIVWATG